MSLGPSRMDTVTHTRCHSTRTAVWRVASWQISAKLNQYPENFGLMMLFSGFVQAFRCTQCNSGFHKVTPTSLLPIGLVVIVSGILWSRTFVAWIGIEWIALLLGFALSMVSMYHIFLMLERRMSPTLRDGVCPQCGGSLKAFGGGFIDGGSPGRVESLTYILTLFTALAFCLMTLG